TGLESTNPARPSSFALFLGPFCDQGCHIATLEAAVDVNHDDTGRTAIEHGEQGGQATEGSPIADAGGHCHDGAINQASHDAWQSTVHAGHDNDGVGIAELSPMPEQTVNAGNPNISQERNFA